MELEALLLEHEKLQQELNAERKLREEAEEDRSRFKVKI